MLGEGQAPPGPHGLCPLSPCRQEKEAYIRAKYVERRFVARGPSPSEGPGAEAPPPSQEAERHSSPEKPPGAAETPLAASPKGTSCLKPPCKWWGEGARLQGRRKQNGSPPAGPPLWPRGLRQEQRGQPIGRRVGRKRARWCFLWRVGGQAPLWRMAEGWG